VSGLKGIFWTTITISSTLLWDIWEKHGHYRAVKFIKEKNDTCYQMFPTEKTFSPEPYYFHFTSALASSLHKGVSLLHAAGFLHVLQASMDFRNNLVALASARPLAAKYENELTNEELKNNRLKENLISLGNFKFVLLVELITILSGSSAFVAEVLIFYHSNIKQKVTLCVSERLEILFCLLQGTKRSFIVVSERVAVCLCTILLCQLHKTGIRAN